MTFDAAGLRSTASILSSSPPDTVAFDFCVSQAWTRRKRTRCTDDCVTFQWDDYVLFCNGSCWLKSIMGCVMSALRTSQNAPRHQIPLFPWCTLHGSRSTKEEEHHRRAVTKQGMLTEWIPLCLSLRSDKGVNVLKCCFFSLHKTRACLSRYGARLRWRMFRFFPRWIRCLAGSYVFQFDTVLLIKFTCSFYASTQSWK